ncbi:hypothetical protein F1D05_07725 [Kribbella qitaiheensis]|uniref:Uncharacterized protein n=1 Tax=Kribbella qitaiheensis TaxID=1544730 RepID=A0A7G6WV00_9ACTN|nr:hypothetical protein [Kribbella qitaiheensis]QNE17815.1 hypothetical protein F1D05_07725 [Kribbella qitaiheensis]
MPIKGASMSDKVETELEFKMGLEMLPLQFPKIDSWRSNPLSQAPPRSALFGDDRRTDPYQSSHLAIRLLSISVDNLHCLKTVISEGKSLHMYAPFGMLRAAIESSATVLWQLSPSRRKERVCRSLGLQYRDAKEERNAENVATARLHSSNQASSNRMRRIEGLAAAADLSEAELRQWVSTRTRQVREGGKHAQIGSQLTELTWQICSGMAHGQNWSTLSMLDRQEVASFGETVATYKLTANAMKIG